MSRESGGLPMLGSTAPGSLVQGPAGRVKGRESFQSFQISTNAIEALRSVESPGASRRVVPTSGRSWADWQAGGRMVDEAPREAI
jgi:hypothetical protein